MSELLYNEADLKRTYEFLGHEKQTELRLIDVNKAGAPKSVFVKDWDEFAREVKKHAGKEYNIYAGIHERATGGTKGAEVLRVKTVVLDIDPERETKQASTNEELEASRAVAEKISEWFVTQGFQRPNLAMSGNGYQLWARIPTVELTDENRKEIESKFQLFQDEAGQFTTEKVKVDKIGDLPRIIKVIGTLSVKGEATNERPHRLSAWARFEQLTPDAKLLEHILNLQPVKPAVTARVSAPLVDAGTHEGNDFERVKARVTIRDLYSVSAKGNSECPFCTTREPRPSLSVTPDGTLFNCFACRAKGDAIEFYRLQHNLTAVDAMKELAKTHGIELTKLEQKQNGKETKDNPEEEVTYSCFVVDGDEIYQQTTRGFVNRAGMTFKELYVGGKKVKPLEGQELDSRDGKLPFLLLADQPEDYVSFKSLIDDTEALIKEYVDIDDNFRKITALYVALTWVQDKLRTTPYWRVKGDFGRGKTRAWEVAKSVCCNPLSASGALTSAPIFRIIEKWRLLTLAIDEADIKQSDASNDIVKIINTGFEAGGGVMRCDQNNPNDIQFFRTFCPKMFSMRTPFQDNATESRCLSTNMEATRRKDIPIELNPKFDAKARALRNRFLDYRLKKWATFTPLDEPKFPEGLEGRLKQIAIAFYPLLETKEDEKWFNDWLTNYQHKIRQERATSYSGMVLQTIRDCCEQYKDADLGADYRFVTNNTVALTLKDSAQAIAKETKALGFKTQVQKWKNINGIQRLQRQLVIDAEKWLEITERYAPEGALAERPELLISDDEKRENQAKLAGMTVTLADKDQNKLVSEVSEISHVSGTENVSGSALYSHS